MSKIEDLSSFFQEKGTQVHPNQEMLIPFPQANHFYLIKNASIDFYFTPSDKKGPRSFLMRLKNSLLFPFSEFNAFNLTAIVREEGSIIDCEQEILLNLPENDFSEIFLESINKFSKEPYKLLNKDFQTQLATITSLLKMNKRREAIVHFSQYFSDCLLHRMNQEQTKDIKTLEGRDSQEEINFESSLSEMQGVLTHIFDADAAPSKDPLFYIFQKIGGAIHFSFTFPKHFPSHLSLEEKIEKICDMSKIRFRKIRLKGTWWNQDMGPLLGFSKDGKTPYALLNGENFLGYTQVGHQLKRKVDAKDKDCFAELAYMFYVPFPSSLQKTNDIFPFLIKHTRSHLKLLFIFCFLGTLFSLFPPLGAFLLFKYAINDSSKSLVSYLALGLFFSTIGISLFYFFRNYCLLKIEGLGIHLVQTALWDRLLKLSPSFFKKFSTGNLYYRIMSTEDLGQNLSNANLISVLNGFFSIFYLIVMFIYSPILSVITFIISFLSLALTLLCISAKMRFLTEFTRLQGIIRGVSLQVVLGVAKLRTCGAEKSAFAYWASLFARSKIWQMKVLKMQNLALAISSIFPVFIYLGIYTAMVYWVGTEKLPLAEFLSFNIALGYFSSAFYLLGIALIDMARVIPSLARTQIILEEPIEDSLDQAASAPLTGHIRMDNIVFSYESSSALVLSGISIEVRPREFVAIVGKSGSGKSTIARLLLRFEKPTSGSIYFDGQDLSHLDPRSVRKQIGSVLQSDKIGGGSLYENLVSGASYSKDQILHALKISGFDKDLAAFPMGLNTFVPAGGETLSGGQKQRILLARAFLSNPEILLLDEATSALDNQFEMQTGSTY